MIPLILGCDKTTAIYQLTQSENSRGRGGRVPRILLSSSSQSENHFLIQTNATNRASKSCHRLHKTYDKNRPILSSIPAFKILRISQIHVSNSLHLPQRKINSLSLHSNTRDFTQLNRIVFPFAEHRTFIPPIPTAPLPKPFSTDKTTSPSLPITDLNSSELSIPPTTNVRHKQEKKMKSTKFSICEIQRQNSNPFSITFSSCYSTKHQFSFYRS